jgi:hypothetical protein
MLWRLLWWCYECQRRWDMNLTSALARVESENAVDMIYNKKCLIRSPHLKPTPIFSNSILVQYVHGLSYKEEKKICNFRS